MKTGCLSFRFGNAVSGETARLTLLRNQSLFVALGRGRGRDVRIFFVGGGLYGLQSDGGWMNRGQQDVMGGGGGAI